MTRSNVLPEHSDDKRLVIYKFLISACSHMYSKGEFQRQKFDELAPALADLTKNDPLFMAHLTAWAQKQDYKDLKVLTVFFNALNDADGTPFFKGSTKNKPNLRKVSAAALQALPPHLAVRVIELCHLKFGIPSLLNNSRHFPTHMKHAFEKYLVYRENNEHILRGLKNAGMSRKIRDVYRLCRMKPTEKAASILGWKQGSIKQGNKENIEIETLPDFSKMTSQEIADELIKTRLSTVVALSIIPNNKITTAVAKALLQNCSGNQSIILYNWFASHGFMDVKSIKELFKDKVKTSTTAVDRIDTLARDADEEDKKELAAVRSSRRKSQARTSELGKIFIHIDKSSSMSSAIHFAKEKTAIIAECLDNPKSQFAWGLFGQKGKMLPVPDGFTKEDFHQALYGVSANDGATDCVALYREAREFGADIDIYVTDQQHNVGNIGERINNVHRLFPNFTKPKAALIISFSGNHTLEDALRNEGIPVAVMTPESLKESALVAQSVRHALVGELAVIDEIMDTPLPTLPKWWKSVGRYKRQMKEQRNERESQEPTEPREPVEA